MRYAVIISIMMCYGLSAQTNKYIFLSGMEFNTWNVSYFNKDVMVYFNSSLDDNYMIYVEAQKVLSENGMDFFNPTSTEGTDDGFVTVTNIVYENVPFGSNAYVVMTYESDIKKVVVDFSEKGSRITVYNK